MQVLDNTTIYSASDLTAFLECRHKVGLNAAAAQGDADALAAKGGRERADEVDLVARHGLAHEHRYLAQLKAAGREVVEMAPIQQRSLAGFNEAAAQTQAEMRAGVEVIFQAVLFDGQWLGYADFLVRVDVASALGAHSYEAHDTKLAQSTKVSALIQLAEYSAHLERLQGVAPAMMYVILGDGSVDAVPVNTAAAYHRRLRRRFLEAVQHDLRDVYPIPVSHCSICDYADHCAQRRIDDDHLSLLPGARRDQVAKLEDAQLKTVVGLSEAPAPVVVPRLATETIAQLQSLAQLQLTARAAGQPRFELKTAPANGVRTGFDLLPQPHSGDLFFDLEGDPFLGEHGREYLWGWCDTKGDDGYTAVWGHTEQTERAAAEGFIDMVIERRREHPGMHIYHYASYEIAVLKHLTAVNDTRQAELDHLLRSEMFVDLYGVSHQALLVSVPSYSIKDLEAFYRPKRSTEVQSGMASVVAYEGWLETGNQAVLDDIEAYNRDDCVSTLELRDWLLSIRPPSGQIPPTSAEEEPDVEPTERELLDARREGLVARLDDVGPEKVHSEAVALLAHLLGFHRRESRPAAWWIFARQQMTDAELVADSESIGLVAYQGPTGTVARSTLHRYTFDPSQEFKLAAGDDCLDPDTLERAGNIYALDAGEGWLDLKVGNAREAPTPRAFIPAWGPPTKAIEEALLELGEWVAEHGIDAPGPLGAARALLRRGAPDLAGIVVGEQLTTVEDPSEALPDLADRLDSSYLAIQGPPGSGKTHSGAELICHLATLGKRVGVTANSHAVIDNLLTKVVEFAGGEFEVAKVGGRADPNTAPFACLGGNTSSARNAVLDPDGPKVVGGTSWFFAHAEMREAFDVLVIDEAGQLSLANALAVATAASSLVLLGDPQQLDQPMQGAHPPGTATSALGHLLDGEDTVPLHLGVFLDRTWRMHPDLCEPVSQLSYNGLLHSRPHCVQQRLVEHGTGIRFEPVQHEGCRNHSVDEARRVAELVDSMLQDRWVDGDGVERPVTSEDILVIAPYNAQVRCLKNELKGRARVGTVDKFQGQEAAVAIYSMAASSAEDIPRGLEFHFSRNRLNVAISRAKCLSIIVGSERLLDANCTSKSQLTLVNGLCGIVEQAGKQSEAG